MRSNSRPYRKSTPRSPYPNNKCYGRVLLGLISTILKKINAQRGLGRGKERGDEEQENTRTIIILNDLFKHVILILS
jgi:hypothetical protein